MKTSFFFLSILIIYFLASCGESKPIKLVQNGQSDYSIVIQESPTAQELHAAEVFQKYVEKMSGCKLPIVSKLSNNGKGIFIKQVEGLKYDGYRIKTENDGNIYINGGQSKGCTYGVITILDTYLGCHLYSPKYAVIPNNKDIRLPFINLADSSVNNVRITFTLNEFAEDQDLLDWNRIVTIEQMYAKDYYCHTFNRLIPGDKYYKSHPEYFAEVDGKRTPDQPCLSNPEVLKISIDQLKKDMAEQPDKRYWSVSQNDGPIYCTCKLCAKAMEAEGGPQGTIMPFVNAIAKEFPDKIISTLAYYYSTTPPKNIQSLDNVQIMLCAGNPQEWANKAKHIYLWSYIVDYWYYFCPYPNLFTLQPILKGLVKDGVQDHFMQANINYAMEFAELRLFLISKLLWNPNIDVSGTINEFLTAYYGDAAPWIRKYIDVISADYEKSDLRLRINTPPSLYQNTFLTAKNIENYYSIFDGAEQAVKNDSNPIFAQHVHLARMSLNFATLEIGKQNMFGSRGWWNSTGTERVRKMDDLLEDFYATCSKANINELNENHLLLKPYYDMTKFTTSNEAVLNNIALGKKVIVTPTSAPEINIYSNNDLTRLTDGVRGDDDKRRLYWIAWEKPEVELQLDLEATISGEAVMEMGTYWAPRSRAFHPSSVECFVSNDAKSGFTSIGKLKVDGMQLKEEYRHVYSFKTKPTTPTFRYITLKAKGMEIVPAGHLKAGLKAMICVDEIVVKYTGVFAKVDASKASPLKNTNADKNRSAPNKSKMGKKNGNGPEGENFGAF